MNFIKRLFLILLILAVNPFRGRACDICGGFMGITPYDNQSSICLMHRYRIFNGYRNYNQKSQFFPQGAYYKVAHGGSAAAGDSVITKTYSSRDYESYKVYELRAKYFIHHRVELNAFIPLNDIKSKTNNITTSHIGLGDPSVFAGFHILKPGEKTWKQRLISGVGIKLPLGNYYAHDQFSNRIPFLLQPGTGSVDGFVYVNYIVSYKKTGFSTNSNFKMNGQNDYQERIGNSFSEFLNVFYRHKFGQVTVIPSVQAYFEYTKGVYVKRQLQPGTKMNSLLIGPGLDLFYKNISINCSFQFCAWEKVEPDDLQNAGRMVIGLCYNFNQTKYMWH
ncbi:MAG: hypothetical protein JST26_18735 [Bacteroidetes bacterium]|nr:hypothetical protein [Bacteroidota bacterium]